MTTPRQRPSRPARPRASQQPSPPPAHLTALFCAIARDARPALPQATTPSDMGPLRPLDAGDGLWLAVADADAAVYDAVPLEKLLRDLTRVSSLALAHERIIERCLPLGTVLPMKLFTLFSSDEAALAHIKRDRRRIDRVAARVDGALEWGLRVRVDEKSARRTLAAQALDDMAGKASGAAFLTGKKHQHEAKRKLSVDLRERAEHIYDELAALARDARRRPPAQVPAAAAARVLLDAAFLVDHDARARFLALVDQRSGELAGDGFHIDCTGPWPCFSFVGDAA